MNEEDITEDPIEEMEELCFKELERIRRQALEKVIRERLEKQFNRLSLQELADLLNSLPGQ